MAHTNEEIGRRAFEAFSAGDRDAISEVYAEDMVYRLGGDSAISGERKGRGAFLDLFDMADEQGIETSYDLHDVLANDEHVVLLISAHLEREGKDPLDEPGVCVMHVDGGQVSEVWSFPFNQVAVRELLS